jgi:smad nuclear-interacting protein 1
MHIQRQSAYLVGRDKTIVDIPVDHPSCSKQHAVIQCMTTLPLAQIQVLML